MLIFMKIFAKPSGQSAFFKKFSAS